jgi:hypothetical protein
MSKAGAYPSGAPHSAQWVSSRPYSQMSNKPEENLLRINDLAYSGLPSVTKKKKFYEINT